MLSKGLGNCNSLRNFFPHVTDLNHYNCPKASEFSQTPIFFVRITGVLVFETTVLGKRPICCLIGFVTLNSSVMCAALKDNDNLHLTLSTNLITVSMNILEKQKSECNTFSFDLVKQEYNSGRR